MDGSTLDKPLTDDPDIINNVGIENQLLSNLYNVYERWRRFGTSKIPKHDELEELHPQNTKDFKYFETLFTFRFMKY